MQSCNKIGNKVDYVWKSPVADFSDCEKTTTTERVMYDKRPVLRVLLDSEKTSGGGAGHRDVVFVVKVVVVASYSSTSSVLLMQPVTPRYCRVLPNVGAVETKKATTAAFEIPPPLRRRRRLSRTYLIL